MIQRRPSPQELQIGLENPLLGEDAIFRRARYALLAAVLLLSSTGCGLKPAAPRRPSVSAVPPIMGQLFRREPVSPGPVAFKLILPLSVHWRIYADPFGTMTTPTIAPAQPWSVTHASTEYLNLDTASHQHPDMAYRIGRLRFGLTVSGFDAGYQNFTVKSPPGSRVTLTQYTAIPAFKTVKEGRKFKKVYTVPIRPRAPVRPLLKRGDFTVFRVQTWIDGKTHVRVVEHIGKTTWVMALEWATYVPFRPPYPVHRVHASGLPPISVRIHQLMAARLPRIRHADGFAVTKIGLAWLQGPSLTVRLWPWRAMHPTVVVKAWPYLLFNSNSGWLPWVKGAIVPMLWRSGGEGNRPWWGIAWNLATGRHRLLEIFGDRPVEPHDNLFGNPPGVFGQIVHLPKGFSSLIASGPVVLGRWHGRVGLYNVWTRRFQPAVNPAVPSPASNDLAWPTVWESWGPSWLLAPATRDLPTSTSQPITIEAAAGKPKNLMWRLPAGDTLSVGSSFLVRENPVGHVFWIAWSSRHGTLVWHYAGSYTGYVSLMNGGVVWTTSSYTWIWRAPSTPGY